MQSLLILSTDKKRREDFTMNFCREQAISSFDQTIVQSQGKVGIEEIRTIQKTIFLKPFQGTQKAVIIHNAHSATIETQNALLKILEEPPLHTFILLTAESSDSLLPTILSRCSILQLENETQLSTDETVMLEQAYKTLQSATIAQKLKIAQDLAGEKEQAIRWIVHMSECMHSRLITEVMRGNDVTDILCFLYSLQKGNMQAKQTNIQIRFILENIFLQM